MAFTVRERNAVDFAWTPELDALREEAERFAGETTVGRDIREDQWIVGYDRDVSRRLGERGWLGMTWPKRYGGHERTAIERFVVTEALIARGARIAASWFSDRQMGPSILAYGTEEQKERFLPLMARGEANWCIGMSDPDNGSDPAPLRTRARHDGDDYVVDGTKV